MNRRARRLGLAARRRLRELPEDDGKIPVVMSDGWRHWIGFVEPAEIQEWAAKKMAVHDQRGKKERWGGNQWGEEWVIKKDTRPLFAVRMPLLKTDLTWREWRTIAAGKSRSRTLWSTFKGAVMC